MLKIIFLSSFFSSIIFSNYCFADTLYVKSVIAKLLESPKYGSKIIDKLKRGKSLTKIKSEKKWTNVEVDKKVGWIPSILLSKNKLMKRKSLLMKNVDISKKARKRASAFTSTAAARGLKSNSDEIFKNLGEGNYEALRKMESLYVPFKISIPFLNEGFKKAKK